MKKVVLFMAGLLLMGSTAFAQDKEALKAQKEAQKAAESLVKKAKSTYESSIANPQYGRKETDYAKLEPAIALVEEAVENSYVNNLTQTWKTAADVEYQMWLKRDAEAKADPENTAVKEVFLVSSSKLCKYCSKFDELLKADPKAKSEEKKLQHVQYQTMAVNAGIQLLQAAQNYSNSDAQDDLKKGAQYADEFLNLMTKSTLMSDFTNTSLNEWVTYAKAFRAQSLLNIQGSSEQDIVNAYNALMDTQYKGIAYQSLSNYYREKNPAKQNEYLKKGIEALKGVEESKDMRANFAFVLLQNQFQSEDKTMQEEALKTIQMIKEEFPDNENTVNAYLMEGQMAFQNQKFNEAEKIFLEAADKYTDEPKCLLMAARSSWMKAQSGGGKKEDMDHTIQLFKKVEAANPEDPEMWGEALYILYNNTQQAALAAPYKKYYKAN